MLPATLNRASHGYVRKLLIGALTALLLFATLVIAPSARAVDQNDADYWEDKFDHPATCYKHDPPTESNPHGTITNDGKAVTLFPFNPAWPGDHWEALIVNAGSVDSGWGPGNAVYVHPSAGEPYFGPLNAGGQQPVVSHWIVCKGTSQGDPDIDIEKATNGFDADSVTGPSLVVGSTVTWTYEVTNIGNVPLANVTVTDDQAGVVPAYQSGDTNSNTLLDLTETWTYQATGSAVEGQYANIGTVTGFYPQGEEEVTDEDPSHYIGYIPTQEGPDIDIEKATNGFDADSVTGPSLVVGSTVTWTYEVTNIGNVPLANVTVTDDQAGVVPAYQSGDTNSNTLLDLTETWTYQATGSAVEGQYANIGTVTGFYPQGEEEVTDEDPSHYYGYTRTVSDAPDIAIDKSVDPAVIPVGETTTVTWTIVVTNTGDVTLYNVEVTDVGVPACDLSIGTLAVAASSTHKCTSSHAPPNLAWSFRNVAVATGESGGTTVTDNDDATVLPSAIQGTAQLGDTVWLDVNKNGVQDSGEVGYNGADVILKDADGNVVGTLTTATGAWVGFYKFVGLDAGTYTAMLDLSTIGTYKVSTATAFTVTLAEGDDYLDADFGLYEDAAPPTTVPPEETLPTTGLDSERLAVVAIALLILGALAVLATRRWRIEDQ